MDVRFKAWAGALLLLCCACSGGGAGGAAADAGFDGNTGGSAGTFSDSGSDASHEDSGGGGAGGSNIEPGETCRRYVECTAATNPGALGLISEQYGEDGSCWRNNDPQLCETACVTGLRQSHQAFPNESACPECLGDAQCPDPARPGCDLATETCVSCTRDAHCSAPTPACDSATHACVTCTDDSHCGGNTPACDTATRTCIPCLENKHCPSTAPVCDPALQACVGCMTNADCPAAAPVCGIVMRTCHPCPTCSDFPLLQCGTVGVAAVCGGTLNCGSCAKGRCQGIGTLQTCTTIGDPCTTGGSECLSGEICGYVPPQGSHQCSVNYDDRPCSQPNDCGTTGYCVYSIGKCRRYCQTAADCPSGQSCSSAKCW